MKVLIITGKLQKYRVPIFNQIVESGIDLTVAHSYKKMDDGTFSFKEIILEERKIGPFTKHRINLKKFCSNFDVVVATFYLQRISFMSLLFGNRSYKLAYWGIGVKASQNSSFDKPTLLNYLRYFIARKSDAMIFYTEYAKNKYIKKGIPSEKIFVMNNTVYVDKSLVNINQNKDIIVFIGTLNKSKKVFELLSAYKKVVNKIPSFYKLEIIGKGPDYNSVKSWVFQNDLQDKIIIHGAIYDSDLKAKILNKAICAISPAQAGLSVLEVMGFGVPFITHKQSITGGELLNITDGFNGLLFEDFEKIEAILYETYINKEKFLKMGSNAYEYYWNNRTSKQMVDGFIQTTKYLNNK